MIDAVLQALAALACVVVIVRAEPALSRMTQYTDMRVRIAIWLCIVGAAGRLGWIVLGGVPDPITVIMMIGLAALLICERRIRVLTGIRK